MGEMLGVNMGLKKLDVGHCRLGPEACLLLADGLKVSDDLSCIILLPPSQDRDVMLAVTIICSCSGFMC